MKRNSNYSLFVSYNNNNNYHYELYSLGAHMLIIQIVLIIVISYFTFLQTGKSRGFAFVYFESTDDAKVAKDQCTGMKINGKSIRVDYSITERAHTPTPGIYMGKPS